MRIVFRADASREIGSGHVMRSSVLAEEAISRGFECIFVGKILDLDWVSKRISNLGFAQIISDENLLVRNPKNDLLILDSYSIPVSNTFIARENWKFVLSICDEITPKYQVDMQLRPGLAKVKSAHHGPVVLSGAEYTLIRKGIRKSPRNSGEGDDSTVLIVGGGSDPFGFVRAVTDAMCSLGLKWKAHIFTNDNIPSCSVAEFVLHSIGSDLDVVANDVDVVFTTASTSSLEFIAREIPTGVACAVDNQAGYYRELGRLGYVAQLGVLNPNQIWEFNLDAIKELLESQKKRDSLKESINGLIDLNGASRVMDALVSQALATRKLV